jgi:hypothetical protein
LLSEALQQANIEVIKIGLSGLSRQDIVAGPYHPAFGELVKAELLTGRILNYYIPGKVICISVLDRSLLQGHGKVYLTKIKQAFKQNELKVHLQTDMKRGTCNFVDSSEYEIW